MESRGFCEIFSYLWKVKCPLGVTAGTSTTVVLLQQSRVLLQSDLLLHFWKEILFPSQLSEIEKHFLAIETFILMVQPMSNLFPIFDLLQCFYFFWTSFSHCSLFCGSINSVIDILPPSDLEDQQVQIWGSLPQNGGLSSPGANCVLAASEAAQVSRALVHERGWDGAWEIDWIVTAESVGRAFNLLDNLRCNSMVMSTGRRWVQTLSSACWLSELDPDKRW